MLALFICLGLAQWWLVGKAHEEVDKLSARLVPHGKLRYERLWPYLWGGGLVWGLSFESDGMLGLSLQIPQGSSAKARRIEVRKISRDKEGQVDFVHFLIEDLQFPVPKTHAATPKSTDPARHPLPTLFDLGYDAIRMNVELEIRFIPEVSVAVLKINADVHEVGKILATAQLEGSRAVFAKAQDQIVIRELTIDYADRGLLARGKEVAVARAKLSPNVWAKAIDTRLDTLRKQGKWKWDRESDEALRSLLRQPQGLLVRIDPPSDVRLRNIRLYPAADWPTLLGFSLQAQGRLNQSELEKLLN